MRYRGAMLATVLLGNPTDGGRAAGQRSLCRRRSRCRPSAERARDAGAAQHRSGHLRLDDNLGLDAVGSVGYGLGNGFRFEIQGDFQRNAIHELARTPFPAAAGGTMHTYGVMANALYDMDIGVPWLYPYIGAGAGYQWTNLDGMTLVQAGGPFRMGDQRQRRQPSPGRRSPACRSPSRRCLACPPPPSTAS